MFSNKDIKGTVFFENYSLSLTYGIDGWEDVFNIRDEESTLRGQGQTMYSTDINGRVSLCKSRMHILKPYLIPQIKQPGYPRFSMIRSYTLPS
jgi:hypothetical protein